MGLLRTALVMYFYSSVGSFMLGFLYVYMGQGLGRLVVVLVLPFIVFYVTLQRYDWVNRQRVYRLETRIDKLEE